MKLPTRTHFIPLLLAYTQFVVIAFGQEQTAAAQSLTPKLSYYFCYENQAYLNTAIGKCVHQIGNQCLGAFRYPELFQCGEENGFSNKDGWCACPNETALIEEGPESLYVDFSRCAPLIGRAHGESCDSANPCIQTLFCTEGATGDEGRRSRGVCTCKDPEYSVWRPDEGLCYSNEYCSTRAGVRPSFYERATGRCVSATGRPDQDRSGSGSTCTGQLDKSSCPLNSNCTQTRGGGNVKYICECARGFQTSTDPTEKGCVDVLTLQETCPNPVKEGASCGPSLECRNGTCSCDPENEVWERLGQCKLKAGKKCGSTVGATLGECARNARCEPETGTCVCEESYKVSWEGQCVAPFLGPCALTHHCESGLRCVDGACRCRSLFGEFWDPVAQICKTAVGHPCESYGTEICTDGAHCDPYTSKCVCDEGLFAASNGARCYWPLGFREECSDPPECDHTKGLACMEGVCQCADGSLKYDLDQNRCVAPIGGQCGDIHVPGARACFTEAGTGVKKCESYQVACDSEKGPVVCKEETQGISRCMKA